MPENLQDILNIIQATEFPDLQPPAQRPVLQTYSTIQGSEGIVVSQSLDGEDTVVALTEQGSRLGAAETEEPLVVDYLSGMAFRATWYVTDPAPLVKVNQGYISHAYYDTGWLYSQFEIAEEQVPTGGVYPCLLYLKVPVVTTVVDADDGTGPWNIFTGSSTIEGTPYNFTAETGTSWIGLDTNPVASYYTVVTSVPAADPDFFQMLLAEIPSEGVVIPKTFGNITLPQQYFPYLAVLSVTP